LSRKCGRDEEARVAGEREEDERADRLNKWDEEMLKYLKMGMETFVRLINKP
jgi:hypothetical protein